MGRNDGDIVLTWHHTFSHSFVLHRKKITRLGGLELVHVPGWDPDDPKLSFVFVQLGSALVFSQNLGPKHNTKKGLHTHPTFPTHPPHHKLFEGFYA